MAPIGLEVASSPYGLPLWPPVLVEWVPPGHYAITIPMVDRPIKRRRTHSARAAGRRCLTIVATWFVATSTSAERIPSEKACPVLRAPASSPRNSEYEPIDAVVRDGIGSLYPGAVLLVARHGRVVHRAAFGHAQIWVSAADATLRPLSTPRVMTADTLFDMASITKVEATTAAIMRLVGQGRLSLDDRIGALLPAFRDTDKAGITVRQLLTHRAGLWEWQPTWLHLDPSAESRPYLAALPLRYSVGTRYAYSDLGFMILGDIVANVSGMPLDRYVRQNIYRPLGMTDTGFLPSPSARRRAAATSPGDAYQQRMAESGKPYPIAADPPVRPFAGYRRHILVGEANDANAALARGGVAGHAGLFSTATDLARYAQMLANGGCYGRWRLAPSSTIAAFEQTPFDAGQALGFRAIQLDGIAAPFFGHSGFTGTWFAVSPDLGLTVVLLTNRVHRRDGQPYPSLDALHDAVLRGAVAATGGVTVRTTQGTRAWR